MNSTRARIAQLVLVAAAGSQAGHLVAYEARFGSAAGTLQAAGVHAYFLPLAGVLLGGLGSAALAALLIIGGAGIAAARRNAVPAIDRRPVMEVLPLLFALQVAIYIGQESIETAAAGASGPALLDLLLWGALGQLPVAVVGALAVSWISARFEVALWRLEFALASIKGWDRTEPHVALAAEPLTAGASILAQVSRASFAKRGPPPTS